jgi:hypothetical protein
LLEPGAIFLVPPRDVVQKGQPHEAGVGSGAYLLQRLRTTFAAKGFSTVTTSNPEFSAVLIAPEQAVLEEARRLGAVYALQVVLGEFRNAAPMTFRTDFVILQEAHFWAAATGKLLWSTNLPTIYQANNLGSHERMLDVIGDVLVTNIAGIVAPGPAPATPITDTAPPVPAKATEPIHAVPASRPDNAAEQRLRELLKLKEQGLINGQDFERKKAEILEDL